MGTVEHVQGAMTRASAMLDRAASGIRKKTEMLPVYKTAVRKAAPVSGATPVPELKHGEAVSSAAQRIIGSVLSKLDTARAALETKRIARPAGGGQC